MAETLFVYGTLHPDQAPPEIAAVVREMEPLGTGTIRARLHRFLDYPAIKLDSRNGSRIAGHLFQVPSETAMQQLDAYEEFYPTETERSLFQRKPVRVSLPDGRRVQAWVYEYNRILPKAPSRTGRSRPAVQNVPSLQSAKEVRDSSA